MNFIKCRHFLLATIVSTLLALFFANETRIKSGKIQDLNACFDSAKSAPEKSIHLCKDRAQIVAELVIERDKAEKCEAAISQGFSTADCAPPIQALVLENATQKAQILMLETDQKSAIKRAENRNQTQTKKKIQDVKTLEKAKANSIDGNIICDTECLRARFETD